MLGTISLICVERSMTEVVLRSLGFHKLLSILLLKTAVFHMPKHHGMLRHF